MSNPNLTCRLVFTEDCPALIISFDQFAFTMEEINALSLVLEKTATKWVECQKCSTESCNKEIGDGRRTEGARGSEIIH